MRSVLVGVRIPGISKKLSDFISSLSCIRPEAFLVKGYDKENIPKKHYIKPEAHQARLYICLLDKRKAKLRVVGKLFTAFILYDETKTSYRIRLVRKGGTVKGYTNASSIKKLFRVSPKTIKEGSNERENTQQKKENTNSFN